MTVHRVAARVDAAQLGSYQSAARTILRYGLVSEQRPNPSVLAQVLQWADTLAIDLRNLFGYSLHTTARHARLIRRTDAFDSTQAFAVDRSGKSGKPFDRRRLAYLCLILAGLQRSRIEISLADMVRDLAPHANRIDHLGFDATAPGHKDAVIDAVDWLVAHGALRVSDGSSQDWARDHERGDALYDIDHDLCNALFRPSKPVQHLTTAAGLLETPTSGTGRDARRRATAERARRALIEHPVVYFADIDPDLAVALRQPTLAEDLTRLTGLPVERRAEGIMLVDSTGHFTDPRRRFPGRGGAVNRTAGLLLAKIADLQEAAAHGEELTRIVQPNPAEAHADLLARIDLALPHGGTLTTLVADQEVIPDADESSDDAPPPDASSATLPFLPRTRLEGLIRELYEEFGATSFTSRWSADPTGLLEEAVRLLVDLRLLQSVPGGVLVRPAAGRYRNITAVLPRSADDGQFALDFFTDSEEHQ